MQRLGFIHDMMDVKVLILYVMSRVTAPVNVQQIYELCFQDDCLSYFDICTAIPEMVESNHLQEVEQGQYVVTDKGRETGRLVEDSIAYTVRQRAEDAVDRFNRQTRRSNFVKTKLTKQPTGEYFVMVTLKDEMGMLMTLELTAPDQRQAIRLSRLMEQKAESVYNLAMTELLENEEDLDS